jgi:hypothetical protein
MARVTRALGTAVSILPPFAVVVKHKHENRKIRYLRSATGDRLSQAKNVHSAEIDRQIAEVKGEGTTKEGNVRKWCRLFKKGKIRCDGAPPSGDAHESSGKISSVLHTFRPCAERISLVSSLKGCLSGQGLKSNRETKDVVQNWLKVLTATFFDENIQMLLPLYP